MYVLQICLYSHVHDDNMFFSEAVSAASESEHSFSFFIATASDSNAMLPLSGDLTLGHINDKYWKSNRPLELFYMLDDSSPGL